MKRQSELLIGSLCIVFAVGIAVWDFSKGYFSEAPLVAQSFQSDGQFSNSGEPELLANPLGSMDTGLEVNNLSKQTIQVQKGDTLIALMTKTGVIFSEAQEAIVALGSAFNPKDLKPGQDILITLDKTDKERGTHFVELAIQPSQEKTIVVSRSENGRMVVAENVIEFTRNIQRIQGEIKTSLFVDAVERGLPAAFVNELIRAFSYDVDFQRDLKQGDKFEIVVEHFYDKESGIERLGEILYANLTVSGKPLNIYRFAPSNETAAFYSENGEHVKKALLRTPVDGARISGTFGMRKHPIQG